MTENDLMTGDETAKLLRTTRQALAAQRCLRRDHPPYLKFGRRVLYSRDAVLAWLNEHRVCPAGAKKQTDATPEIAE